MSESATVDGSGRHGDAWLDCVHCGLCLEACPTYADLGTEMDSPRGRVLLMRSVAAGRLDLDARVVRHLDLCLGCRACEPACPSGVRYGALIERTRAVVAPHRESGWRDRLLRGVLIRRILPYPRRLRLALAPLRVVRALGLTRLAGARLERLARFVPEPVPGDAVPAEIPARGPQRGTVGVLRGCVTDVLYPQVTRATVEVLTRLGFAVRIPDSGCCGALHLHAGDRARARRQARTTIAVFEALDVDRIVVNAAGCGAAMREYDELLADDAAFADRAAMFAARVVDFSEIVASTLDELGDDATLGPLTGRATYHDACHLAHAQGVRSAPRRVLERIPGLELVPLADADTCCGSAGTYNLTEPDLADRLAGRKVDAILATGADWVVAGNPGCMLQIAAGLSAHCARTHVLHTAEVVALSLRGSA